MQRHAILSTPHRKEKRHFTATEQFGLHPITAIKMDLSLLFAGLSTVTQGGFGGYVSDGF